MEELDIKQLWHAYDVKLEKSLQLNYKIIRDMQAQKAENNLGAFRRNQVFGVVCGILWILFLVFLVLHALSNLYFVVSVGFIAFFNVFAVVAYIRHLALLDKINVTDGVTQAQETLASIQSSLNNVGRIMVLQAPFYCTFWYSRELVANGGAIFWIINLSVVTLFVFASVYLFRKLTYKNIHIRWVKAFVESFGGKNLSKAMEFLAEVKDYKRE